jgi:adenine-specific DNA-methyltransferase
MARVPKLQYKMHHGNSFELIKKIPTSSINLVVTSPPYNIGKSYEVRTSLDAYLADYEDFVSELYRVLADDGNVAWQVGNYGESGEVFPLDIYFYEIFKRHGFVLRNRVIWHFRHGMHAQNRFSGRYETILWFAKQPKSVFNLDPVRIESLYPGKLATKGPNKGKPSGNPLGKNPSDFWPDIALEEWELGVWDIPNVKSHHPEKTAIHPCQFPIELVDRCVLAMSDAGQTVLDPFLGVGSSLLSSLRQGRKFIGFEMHDVFIQAAEERVQLLKEGKLKVREPGTPIKKPSGKMAARPKAWN